MDPATTLLRALADRSARSVGLLTAATSASASAASSSGGTSQPARNGDRGFASMKVGGPYTSHAIGGTPIPPAHRGHRQQIRRRERGRELVLLAPAREEDLIAKR